ncbi:MAG: glycerol-3-phosphate dehydrogenase [Pseudomonadota bacterium]
MGPNATTTSAAETEAEVYDLFIIGGGINGCGVARDAAGRGYKVMLAEKGDLAQGTSSGSTKLIHGGLRYLEHYEFRLVRESLKERETLWAIAPHIIWPMRFVLPHAPHLRPAWLLRLGLFIYDHIGGRKKLPPARSLDLRTDPAGEPLRSNFQRAFEYSDCWVDDARLVILNARDAADRGAAIRTRAAVTKVERSSGVWRVSLRDLRTGQVSEVRAGLVINAAGPWVDVVLNSVAGQNSGGNVRHVQGSHIVVSKLFDHPRSYIFQNPDGRIIFAIPYEQDFTLIGTTDQDYVGELDDIAITTDEIDYLCTSLNSYFGTSIGADDVVWSYSAVRPLHNDGSDKAQEATRDYTIRMDGHADEPKLISIFGGKITTYRRLALEVLDRVNDVFQRSGKAWTDKAPLPGGDFSTNDFEKERARLKERYAFLDGKTAYRLIRSYGTTAHRILDGATEQAQLGESFGGGLSEREVEYLRRFEWAETADDILWRRSKLGLQLNPEEQQRLSDWLTENPVAKLSVTVEQTS